MAERGRWSEMVMEAHTMYRESNTDGALLLYILLAELGYEVAQSNVAYMLDKSTSIDYYIFSYTQSHTHGWLGSVVVRASDL